MQADITFSENNVGTKAIDYSKIFRNVKPIQGLHEYTADSCLDERSLRYEKYINGFCWVILIASVIYLTPICVNIFIR